MTLLVQIKKNLGKFQLHMDFEAGNETLALLGASGCGKSMTLKCVAGVETPDEGRIVLNDRVLYDSCKRINLSPQQRKIGYLFQNYALFPHMTVEENIAIGIKKPKRERMAIVQEKIEAFYLGGLQKKYPALLSGGQQQRVALARILASEPEIMMLDEPFSALDSYLRWQMEKELTTVIRSFEGTTLFVSHDRDEAYRLCPRIAILREGKIDLLRDRDSLFEKPETLAAAQITGCKNFSRAEQMGERSLFAKDWNVMLESGAPIGSDLQYVGYRAHYIEIVTKECAKERNVFPCRVRQVLEDTFTFIIMVESESNQAGTDYSMIRLEMPKKDWLEKADEGEKLFIRMLPEKILLLR